MPDPKEVRRKPPGDAPRCAVETHGISVEFAMRTVHQRRWFRRYTGGTLHEPALTQHILDRIGPGDTFVDVGAHLGWFSVLAAAKGADVLAFEMQAGLLPMIEESVILNELESKVSVVCAGLGNRCGLISYRRESLAPTKGVLAASEEDDVVHAPCLTMDAALADTQPRMIKIDVEGFEGRVLEGGRETLLARRPSLVLELHAATEDFGHSIPGVLRILDELGYSLECYDSHRREDGIRSSLKPEQFDDVRTDSVIVAEPA